MVPSSLGHEPMYLIKIPFTSQLSALKIVSKGEIWGESHSTSQNFTSFPEKLCESQKKNLNKPHLSPLLWESEASCRFHSPLCQRSNHSPVCKPPVLQDIGNLEQETTVIHTLTSLSLHTQLTRMGDRKAPEHGDCPSHSGLYQVHTLDDPQVRRGQATF